YRQHAFPHLPKSEPSSAQTPAGIAVGSAIGATIGGLALVVTALVTGGAVLLAAGTVLLGGGLIAGTFIGALMSRGFDQDIAAYYDRAVQQGQILVAVETAGDNAAECLEHAECLLAESGAEALPHDLPGHLREQQDMRKM